MTSENDSALQRLFDIARQELVSDEFVAHVMSRIDALRRRALIGWTGAGGVLVVCAWLLATPLMEAANLLTLALPTSVFDLDNDWAAQLLSPLNSVAGLVAVAFLGLWFAYRKIFA